MKKIVFLFHENDAQIPNERSPAMTWWYGILENMGYDVAYYDYVDFKFDDFYAAMKEYKPDFIIHAAYDKVHTEFVKLREIAKTFVIQSDDDYRFYSFGVFWIPFVDGVISFCGARDTMKKMYFEAGATEETFLHGYWSFNPNTMMYDRTPEVGSQMTHAGSVYGRRQHIIDEFVVRGFEVDVVKNVKYEEFKRRVANSLFTLCLTQSAADFNIRQLKGRIFELPYHTVLVSEHFPDMETYYDLDKEIIVFTTVDEAVAKLNEIDELQWSTLAHAGRKRLLANHTAYHVWDRYILPKMDADYKPLNVASVLKEKHGIVI
jgi:hypothetical protein